jgi:hypothetical protein
LCVVRRFRGCANVIECIYTNLDSIAYYSGYKPVQHVTVLNTIGSCNTLVIIIILYYKVKLKCTLVQALRLCTGRTAHRGCKGIALLFHDYGTKRCEGSASRSGHYLPGERPGTHCTGGLLGPRPGLDRCGKFRPYRDSIPGPSSS